jgi:hypothetical protein
MLRILSCFLLVTLSLLATAQKKPDAKNNKEKVVSESLVRSKYVYIGILRADGGIDDRINPAVVPEDRDARDAVEKAFRQWNRYTVTLMPNQADLVVLVRKGRHGSVTVSGTPIQISGGTARTERRTADDKMRTTQGIGIAGEAGPTVDIMEVHTGPNLGGGDLRLWQGSRSEGFSGTPPRLFQDFKNEIEAAAKKLGL